MNPYGWLPSPACVDVCVWIMLFPCECLSGSHFCGWCSRLGMCECVCCWCLLPWLFFAACAFPQPVHDCVFICVQLHFLCAFWSVLAFGPKDALHSPRPFHSQLWIRDGAMICGNDFLNATNLCFPPFLPISQPPPFWATESALLCALNER